MSNKKDNKQKKRGTGNLITVITIASLLLMVAIHSLFKCEAPCNWLEATWQSGDVLSYCGTVFLGVVAVWQNIKLSEENDKSQEKIIELAEKANSISEKYNEKIAELQKQANDANAESQAKIAELSEKANSLSEKYNTELAELQKQSNETFRINRIIEHNSFKLEKIREVTKTLELVSLSSILTHVNNAKIKASDMGGENRRIVYAGVLGELKRNVSSAMLQHGHLTSRYAFFGKANKIKSQLFELWSRLIQLIIDNEGIPDTDLTTQLDNIYYEFRVENERAIGLLSGWIETFVYTDVFSSEDINAMYHTKFDIEKYMQDSEDNSIDS